MNLSKSCNMKLSSLLLEFICLFIEMLIHGKMIRNGRFIAVKYAGAHLMLHLPQESGSIVVSKQKKKIYI